MDPLADDAALSQVNLLLDLEDYDNVSLVAQQSTKIFAGSQFLSSFQYMKSLAAFYQNNFQQAIESATLIADGNSENKLYPRLAGQYKNYLIHSLNAYKSGERQNAIMSGFAAGLSEQDIIDLSTYYSKQKGLKIIPKN